MLKGNKNRKFHQPIPWKDSYEFKILFWTSFIISFLFDDLRHTVARVLKPNVCSSPFICFCKWNISTSIYLYFFSLLNHFFWIWKFPYHYFNRLLVANQIPEIPRPKWHGTWNSSVVAWSALLSCQHPPRAPPTLLQGFRWTVFQGL